MTFSTRKQMNGYKPITIRQFWILHYSSGAMTDGNDKIYTHNFACFQAKSDLYNYIYDKLHRFGLFVL